MKTILAAVLLFPLALFAQRGMVPVSVKINGQLTPLYNESHALLVGVSRYTNGWSSLRGVDEDIPAVKSALERNGFSVTVVMNPEDVMTMKRAIDQFVNQHGKTENNRLLFYFALHGHTIQMPYGGSMGYLCPGNVPDPNVNPDGFVSMALPMDEIDIYAKKIKSKHALFLFDACFAGQIFSTSRAAPEVIQYKTKDPVRQFITSGDANETVADESLFRRLFIRALEGDADKTGDGYLTGSELGLYLQENVVNLSKGTQHPQYGKIRNIYLDKGDFVFVMGKAEQGNPQEKLPVVMEEKNLVQYGKLELTTWVSGTLYDGDTRIKTVNAGSALTLGDMAPGKHTIRLVGEETVEQEVDIPAGGVATLTIEKKPVPRDQNLPDMVYVEGGTFQMGSNDGGSDEKPVHQVTVSSFYMGKYEVTQKKWREVMGCDPWELYFKRCDDCPVENVSWIDVQEFITKLNRKTGKNYRLPTEAEWEFAARGGNKSKGYSYSGSNNVDDVAWYGSNSGSKTHPVGQKQPNELGLFDMSGNVWEWCSDWHGNYPSGAQVNPTGPSTGSYRVFRGGSWCYVPQYCRSSNRYDSSPDGRSSILGFRLVLDPKFD